MGHDVMHDPIFGSGSGGRSGSEILAEAGSPAAVETITSGTVDKTTQGVTNTLRALAGDSGDGQTANFDPQNRNAETSGGSFAGLGAGALAALVALVGLLAVALGGGGPDG